MRNENAELLHSSTDRRLDVVESPLSSTDDSDGVADDDWGHEASSRHPHGPGGRPDAGDNGLQERGDRQA